MQEPRARLRQKALGRRAATKTTGPRSVASAVALLLTVGAVAMGAFLAAASISQEEMPMRFSGIEQLCP